MSRLDEIRARAEAATLGPWVADGTEIYGSHPSYGGPTHGVWVGETCRVDDPDQGAADAAFIAAARADIPWLLAEVERLTAVAARLRDQIDAEPAACDSRIAHECGAVLRCSGRHRHVAASGATWDDDDPRVVLDSAQPEPAPEVLTEEPGPEVTEVWDRDGDRWIRAHEGGWCCVGRNAATTRNRVRRGQPWQQLARHWGPLTTRRPA